MRITGATREQIEAALAEANKRFAGNLKFARLDPRGRGFMVRLGVVDSHGQGARLGNWRRYTPSGQPCKPHRYHLAHACWHAHGYFMDALPSTARVHVGDTIEIGGACSWTDRNIGSIVEPMYFSEACECS